ncbi:hypothetical protein ACR92M_02975 [Klebsiella pneumoniae]|nr:hypothetical protein [Klebsiella pneumoniae]HBT0118559.1 hypothetical protein [Klebsiella pneumoniae]HBT0146358.1 hypothetical protein [Klebsiella pneumoniae]HBT0524531.1 hypothetical protein [Klebsiella pneumoniae]HCC2483884.1 hypothetical protein [Klebsiella pneumoniae]
MSNGLAINIPTSFSRVLTDLSFIHEVQSDSLAYTGLYGPDKASSIINATTGGLSSKILLVEVRNGDRVAYGKGFFSITGTGADTSGGTGVRSRVNLTDLDRIGFPCSFVTAFRNIKKVRETVTPTRRLYPIASFYYDSTVTKGSPFLTIAAGIADDGTHFIAAYSGSIESVSDADARLCYVDVDWTATDKLITAGISRAANGTVNLAVIIDGVVKTASYGFPVQTDVAVSDAYVLVGSQNKHTLDSGEFMAGQFWYNKTLTLSELQQQIAVTHLKASARL